MSDIGDLIKEHRLACNLSQKKLGDACGISDAEIMRIENGDRKTPSWSNLCKIAKALKCILSSICSFQGILKKRIFIQAFC